MLGGYENGAGRVKKCRFEGNIVYRNDQHRKDQNGELWIQFAEDNVITGNVFWGGKDTPIINVDKEQVPTCYGKPALSDAGAADAYYNWGD